MNYLAGVLFDPQLCCIRLFFAYPCFVLLIFELYYFWLYFIRFSPQIHVLNQAQDLVSPMTSVIFICYPLAALLVLAFLLNYLADIV